MSDISLLDGITGIVSDFRQLCTVEDGGNANTISATMNSISYRDGQTRTLRGKRD
jgi:hypothetical protein